MAKSLLIAHGGPEDTLTQVDFDDAGNVIETRTTVLNALGQSVGHISLLLPGEDVRSWTLDLPAKSVREARDAAKFALDGKVAQALDEVHLAVHPVAEGKWAVYVIAAKVLESWLEALAQLGVDPKFIGADYALLDHVPGVNRHAVFNGRHILCLSDGQGLACDENLWSYLCAEFEDLRDERAFVFHPLNEENAVNLRQGRFKAASQKAYWPRLGPVGMGLAACLALLALSLPMARTWQDHRIAQAYEEAALRQFQTALPEVKRIVNPQAQMRARLATLGEEAVELELIETVFKALQDVENVALVALRYDKGDGGIRVSFDFGSYEDMALLKSALQRSGVIMAEGAARAQNGRIIAQAEVRKK